MRIENIVIYHMWHHFTNILYSADVMRLHTNKIGNVRTDVTLGRVRLTVGAVEIQSVLRILCLCL